MERKGTMQLVKANYELDVNKEKFITLYLWRWRFSTYSKRSKKTWGFDISLRGIDGTFFIGFEKPYIGIMKWGDSSGQTYVNFGLGKYRLSWNDERWACDFTWGYSEKSLEWSKSHRFSIKVLLQWIKQVIKG